jgi:hypothetical protein
MKVSITNSTLRGSRLVYLKIGSARPDVIIHGSYISGDDVVFMERDPRVAKSAAPGKRRRRHCFAANDP